MKVMVFAAHPDDEIIGVGGALAKHVRQGDEVSAVIMAEGKSSRKADYVKPEDSIMQDSNNETKQALSTLGIEDFVRLNLPDNRLDSMDLLDVVKEAEKQIERFQPDIVYTQYGGDINIDHTVVFRAVMTATRPLPGHFVKQVLAYETLSSTEWNYLQKDQFHANYFINIEEELDMKLKAMACYGSELRDFPHPRSLQAIENNAYVLGAKSGFKAAEAFMLVRGTW
ncbi:PIG-L deacetylase family protein [Bacillus atrophaeus]|uniref:PIG-L deacetylase family protein n=1 Tax=Bacillus atrophaeus TaxID=1452 RepID=UPI003873AB17